MASRRPLVRVNGRTAALPAGDTIDKASVGLDSVDNTADANKQVSTPQQTALNLKVDKTAVGAANGVAGLDAAGKVPAAQLPSYVDDVLEYATLSAFPTMGETGKIYICDTPYTQNGVTSSQFRWSGSAYVAIVASPGSTDSVTEGSTNQYFTVARVLASALTGIDFSSTATLVAADTVLSGLGKLQAQITAAAAALAANVRSTVLTGLVTTTNSAVAATDTVLAALGKLQAQVAPAYNKSNILGTVSQTSGVPTGAIIETGVNSNGRYIKYADGTLICLRKDGPFSLASGARANAPGVVSWAAQFASTPYAALAIEGSYPDFLSANMESAYPNVNGNYYSYRSEAPATVSNIYITSIGIGRWF